MVKFSDRAFLLEGKKLIDLPLGSYIDRKYIFEFMKYISKQFVGGRLMDFGCGHKPYEPLFHVDEYIGVDIETSGHEKSDKRPDVYWDGKVLPFSDETFDFAITTQAFEHIYDNKNVMTEICRVIKHGGVIAVTVPCAWPEHEAPYDFFRYTRYGLYNMMKEAGFSKVKVYSQGTDQETMAQLKILNFHHNILLRGINNIIHNLPPFLKGTWSLAGEKDSGNKFPLHVQCHELKNKSTK